MNNQATDLEKLKTIFFPHSKKRTDEFRGANKRFVYYTTAAVATNILRTQTIWMRNATVMNDFMEISHGFECLNAAYKGSPGAQFKSALNSCFPRLADDVELLFNSWLPHIREDSYLTCISEHHDQEDQHGRLSLWRAYGGSNGVALVLNPDVMFAQSNVLGAFSSPVHYANQVQFGKELEDIAASINRECDYVRALGKEKVTNIVFHMLRFAVLCTKHPGFQEELEWRVTASPNLHPNNRLKAAIEVVNGTPQKVLKIKLENDPANGLVGLEPAELLNRIIIGPCEFPIVTYRAFHDLLNELKIPDVDKKIFVSDIPLRHSR